MTTLLVARWRVANVERGGPVEDRLPAEGLAELVELGDPAALLRAVDGLCASRDWAGLVDLRQGLEEAVERGRPLWPVTTYVEYRLALDAPAPEAAGVLRPGAGRFALGPLTEVAATTHSFAELAPHLAVPSVAGAVAQERVLRGEDLRGVPGAHAEVLELPLVLEPWEPAYALATYRPDEREVPDPGAEAVPLAEGRAEPGPVLRRPEVTRALTDLVEVWTSESGGEARAVVVEGGPGEAVAALGHPGHRLGRVAPASAMARMAWRRPAAGPTASAAAPPWGASTPGGPRPPWGAWTGPPTRPPSAPPSSASPGGSGTTACPAPAGSSAWPPPTPPPPGPPPSTPPTAADEGPSRQAARSCPASPPAGQS
jgi:hypothetical protein